MKKHFSLLLATAFALLTSCQNNEEFKPESEGMGSIKFNIINYEQCSLDDVTRATTADKLGNLDMVIYDSATDAVVSQVRQTKGDENYASFSATLPFGEYHVVFLGYDGSRKAIVETPTSISFADDFVPDFFYNMTKLTINKKENTSKTISLKRPIAALSVQSEGKVPDNLSKITISSEGGSHHFNALTGYGTTVENRSYTYNVSSLAGKDALGISFFTFLTTQSCKMNFTVSAFDKDNTLICKQEFKDVNMGINQMSRFTGNLFAEPSSATSFNLTLEDADWDEHDYTY